MNAANLRETLSSYLAYLAESEKAPATLRQYRRSIERFLQWLETVGAAPDRDAVVRYKETLKANFRPATVNVRLAALGSFFTFLNRPDLKVKQLRLQREAYCPQEKELTAEEYKRLVDAAKKRNDEQLALVLQTICATGIRVSELKFITVEAVKSGEANVSLKRKNRKILIPRKLRKLLLQYVKEQERTTGPVFVTRTGKPLGRTTVWRRMKRLCAAAKVNPKKVFPHNLRHLFARKFYAIDHDLVKLADVLGHSSVNTTRIYLVTTAREHRKRLDRMGLVWESGEKTS